ncbi:hypothetical protein B0H21DRAFT_871247 [Amylocystis lapponica]|nr:hypothetical protein B0H21DRAFT_871247 [Amylocystis lapponica]
MKLIATAIVLAGLVPFSYQFTVNSPASVTECEPTMLSWNGGVPPYYPALIPPGQPGGQAIKQFPETNSTSLTWRVDLPAGTGFSISLTDSTGQTVYSSTENVHCVNSSVSESDVQPGPTAASSMGASSTGATTTGAAIAAASTSSGSSSSGSSSASKTGSATSSGATPSKTSNSAGRGPSIGAYGAAAVLAAAGAVLF